MVTYLPSVLVLLFCRSQRNKKVVSHDDSHYWAKGTGFGTGSTTSNWDIEATLAKKKLEEKYIALCFTILAEYLEVKGHTDATPTDASEELVEMLGDSCLLPALASYLHNDSGEDVCVLGGGAIEVVEVGVLYTLNNYRTKQGK